MRQQKLRALGRLHLGQRSRVLERVGERLIEDDVDARFQERLGRGPVHVVGRHDRDRLNAIRAGGFGLGHLLIGGVDAIVGEAQVPTGFPGHFGPRRQGARHQFVVTIDAGRDAVHIADKGSRAAADHAQANALCAVLSHFSLPVPRCLPRRDHPVRPGGP